MQSSQIGPTIRIKGEVAAEEPLVIAGQVDGAVTASGHEVTVAEGGNVKADVTADRIIVNGAVHGRLTANSVIFVRATGRVEGELSAPAVSLAEGAYVCARVEATGTPRVAMLRTA